MSNKTNKVVDNIVANFETQDQLEIAARCWTDALDINKHTVYAFLNQMDPDLRDEFIAQVLDYDAATDESRLNLAFKKEN